MYIELHSRSAFSFLRGASLPEQLAETAGTLDMPAMALCDRDGVYGAPRFSSHAREAGVRPILGAELTLEDGSVLPVLVESRAGYRNLCQLLTRAHLRSEKGKARVCWSELPEFADGLIALTGADDGPLVAALRQQPSTAAGHTPSHLSDRSMDVRYELPVFEPFCAAQDDFVERYRCSSRPGEVRDPAGPQQILSRLLTAFGRDRVFVELQRHRVRGEERVVRSLVEIAQQFKLPLLATNGVLYARDYGRQVLDVFTCLRHHTHLDAAGLLLEQNSERHLKSAGEMRALFADLPEAIDNTMRLAARLQFTLDDLGYEFPSYPVGAGETMDGVLRAQAFAGARQRYGAVPEKVRAQLEMELALIERLGFAGYFLIVADLVKFCREQNILAQGRGSAANSTVCFCLGITNVDPLKFNTLFERFLSEGRKSWPDIDIDLPSGDRRERVIQEVYRRYGRTGAAMTANVISYRGRSAARELGKALNIGGDVLDRFSHLFANGDFPHTLDLAAQMQQAGLPKEHPRAAAFGTLYSQIYGLPRHLGQHSGGMIICQGKLDSIVPLENASMPGRVVAQWDKDDCENLGIIKVDLLGLGMMSVLQDAVELTRARGREVDLAQLPIDDPKTYEMMQAADTVGVFQIESRAQMATLPRMKPKCFYDVCVEVAIIRPGPIQGHLTHPYLARRAGKEPVTYYDKALEPVLKPILERTLGVPLFQEQMLEMAMKLADFSGSEAEELRRALSFHRSEDRMQRVSAKLETALKRKGYSQTVIAGVLDAITSFALYGFPESHAISFAHLAYASAYLKAHRAPEFYTSLLNNQPMGFYSPATLIKDGQRHGLKFRPVCVQRSQWLCTIEPGTGAAAEKAAGVPDVVRLGLCVVRGLSSGHARLLLAERAVAPFTSIEDLKRRVRLNKDELRTLAEIGALNGFAAHRRDAMWAAEKEVRSDDLFVDPPMSRSGPAVAETMAGSSAALSEIRGPLPQMNALERLRADFTGMQLTTGCHPMALIRPRLKDVWRAADLPKGRHGDTVRIAGNVICRQRPGTAKGFVFISLEDETGISNAIVAPGLFEDLRLLITEESFLLIQGTLQNVDNVIHVRARRIERLQHEQLVGSTSYDFH